MASYWQPTGVKWRTVMDYWRLLWLPTLRLQTWDRQATKRVSDSLAEGLTSLSCSKS